MRSYGKVVASLRKERGLTQNDLGMQLNVTYQAVSKWENDLSQPDFDTIVAMCRIFGITVDEFTRLADGEEIKVQAEEECAPAESAAVQESVEAQVVEEEISEPPAIQSPVETPKRKFKLSVGYLIGLILSIAAGVGICITILVLLPNTLGLIFGLIVGYLVFATIVQIGHQSLTWEFLVGSLTQFVRMPGVIFTLDLDGILFLIVYKFIIAPLATILICLACAIGGIILTPFVAGFMFPFKIPLIYRDLFWDGRFKNGTV